MSIEPKDEKNPPALEHEPKQEMGDRELEPAAVSHSFDGIGGAAVATTPGELDRRLEVGDGISLGEAQPEPAPRQPLHGTYAGELVRRIRLVLEEFEQHVANDARDAAGVAHDLIIDMVDELRGHFHRE